LGKKPEEKKGVGGRGQNLGRGIGETNGCDGGSPLEEVPVKGRAEKDIPRRKRGLNNRSKKECNVWGENPRVHGRGRPPRGGMKKN